MHSDSHDGVLLASAKCVVGRFIAFGLALTSITASQASIDVLGDGMCDVWQQFYDAFGLDPDGDEDLDGCSNRVESIAGTNPRDPNDCHAVGGMALTAAEVVFDFEAEAGKQYQILSAANPMAPAAEWMPEGSPFLAGVDGAESLSIAKPTGENRFFRLSVSDVDSDEDGVSDWAEDVTGMDPESASSPTNGSRGMASDLDSLMSLLSVTVEVVDGDAFEKHDTLTKKSARIRVSRGFNPGAGIPLFVPFDTTGALDVTKGSASATDFTLRLANGGGVITGEVPMSATELAVELEVEPSVDSVTEVPEQVRLRCWAAAGPGSQPLGEAEVHICDANPVPMHRKLYVAYLGREAGVLTTATGIATALVEGDNDLARVSVTFSNLTSGQNTAYIRIGNDLDVRNLPVGQASNVSWQIRAAHFLTSDQAMLNALHDGNCYLDITTENYVDGEISGIFRPAVGSETPPTPDAPPALPNLAGFDLDRDIYRFLTQATFGPTTDAFGEVKALVDGLAPGVHYTEAFRQWIDQQIALPASSWTRLTMAADLEEFLIRNNAAINDTNDPQFEGNAFNLSNGVNNIDNNNHPSYHNRRREWWTLVVNCKDQLRQRMAQALTEICVISENDATVQTRHYGSTHYWDQLAEGAFGRYRDLLEDVTFSPMMGIYLSHLKNQKASGAIFPDENYAREIMQLFSVGLVLRHDDGSLVLGGDGLPIPTYDQVDITELARVMTGLSFGTRHQSLSAPRYPTPGNQDIGPLQVNTNFFEGNNHRFWQGQWMNPMRVFATYHDYGQKELFGGKVGAFTIPARNPANEQNGLLDLRDAHNALAGDPAAATYDAGGGHPNTPVFISRLLIQRFVTSNPSAGYLYRVTQAYKDSNGSLSEVIKAILLDYEARSLELVEQVGSGKPKETLIHYTAVLRALKTKSGVPLETIRTDNLAGYFPATWTVDSPSKYVPDLNPFPQSEYNKYPSGACRLRHNDTNGSLGMSPLRAPSVFNWFLPDYVLPGPISAAGLVSPELQILTDSQVVNVINALWALTWSSTILDDNPPAEPGFGGDNFFNLHGYKKADPTDVNNPTAAGVIQLPMPQIVIDRGYRSDTGTGGGTDHDVDKLMPDFGELYDLYEGTYDIEIGGGASNTVAHHRAIEVLVDQVDLWLCCGYLKHRWGDMPSAESPRKSVIDFCRSLAQNAKAGNANGFRNDVINRVRYVCYLISICPQAMVQR